MSERTLSLKNIFPQFSYNAVGHYQPLLDTNPHTIIEVVLAELLKNRNAGYKEVYENLSKQPFKDTSEQRCLALALMLKLQAFKEITLVKCDCVKNPSETKNMFVTEDAQKTVLGITIDDVEYLLSPEDVELDRGIVVSSLETASHVDKNTLYIKRIITDGLHAANKDWNPVQLPLWKATIDGQNTYYKAHERTELVLE